MSEGEYKKWTKLKGCDKVTVLLLLGITVLKSVWYVRPRYLPLLYCCTVLLYCCTAAVLYYTVLYCTVLYCTVLGCNCTPPV